MTVGTGTTDIPVIGAVLTSVDAGVMTGPIDAVLTKGESVFEAAALPVGTGAEMLALAEPGLAPEPADAVAFNGTITVEGCVTAGAALSVELAPTTDAEIEKPTEVKVAVVVGDANKILLELTTLVTVASEGAEVGSAELEPVGATESVTEAPDDGVEADVGSVAGRAEDMAVDETAGTSELARGKVLVVPETPDVDVTASLELATVAAALDVSVVGAEAMLVAAEELTVVCALATADVALGVSRDSITEDPDVIVAIVGTTIETMLCAPWFFPASSVDGEAVDEGARVRAGVVIGSWPLKGALPTTPVWPVGFANEEDTSLR